MNLIFTDEQVEKEFGKKFDINNIAPSLKEKNPDGFKNLIEKIDNRFEVHIDFNNMEFRIAFKQRF